MISGKNPAEENSGSTQGMKDPTHRMSMETGMRWQQHLDLATEVLLYAIIVLSAWGFGATQVWVVRLLNQLSWALAGLYFLRRVIFWASGWSPGRWGETDELIQGETSPNTEGRWRRFSLKVLFSLTVLILLYCCTAWMNARARLSHDGTGVMEYRTAWIPWLPHSYDATSTGWAFESFLAVAIAYWSTWEWVRRKTRAEQESYVERLPERMNAALPFIPERARRLLWVFFTSGALLALASILQRLSGTNDLLWAMPGSMGDPSFHFGAFNYRANGAQYFNLLWPLCLAFWWLTRVRHQAQTRMNERAGTGAHAVLFPFGILMGACPLISTNRIGALLSMLAVPVVYAVLALDGKKRGSRNNWSLHALFATLIAFGLYLGWVPLEQRLNSANPISRVDPSWLGRMEQYRTTARLVQDHWLFGTGAFAYGAVHAYYLETGQSGYQFVHSDWLQTVAEWGVAGSAMIFLIAAVAIMAPWAGTAGEPVLVGMGTLGAVLVLIHAMVDFPFQIHGILLTFVLLLAILMALPHGRERS